MLLEFTSVKLQKLVRSYAFQQKVSKELNLEKVISHRKRPWKCMMEFVEQDKIKSTYNIPRHLSSAPGTFPGLHRTNWQQQLRFDEAP